MFDIFLNPDIFARAAEHAGGVHDNPIKIQRFGHVLAAPCKPEQLLGQFGSGDNTGFDTFFKTVSRLASFLFY